MRNYPVKMISAVDTASQSSNPIFVGQVAAASFTPVFGDVTAAGTLAIYGSNEIPVGNQEQYVPSAGSFCAIPNATSTIAAGVGPAIVLPTLSFQYVKAIYTRSSGGSSTVLVNATFLGI